MCPHAVIVGSCMSSSEIGHKYSLGTVVAAVSTDWFGPQSIKTTKQKEISVVRLDPELGVRNFDSDVGLLLLPPPFEAAPSGGAGVLNIVWQLWFPF